MKIEKITENATQDDLTDDQYWEIYTELRDYNPETGSYPVSLDKFILKIGGEVSKALWSQYHTSKAQVDAGTVDSKGNKVKLVLYRRMRNELRAAVGLPLLPPLVEETMSGVNPDAAVLKIGDDQPDKVLLIGTTKNLRIDVSEGNINACVVSAVTGTQRPRRRLIRPIASDHQNEAKNALGRSWSEIIDAGIEYLSGQQKLTEFLKEGKQ